MKDLFRKERIKELRKEHIKIYSGIGIMLICGILSIFFDIFTPIFAAVTVILFILLARGYVIEMERKVDEKFKDGDIVLIKNIYYIILRVEEFYVVVHEIEYNSNNGLFIPNLEKGTIDINKSYFLNYAVKIS